MNSLSRFFRLLSGSPGRRDPIVEQHVRDLITPHFDADFYAAQFQDPETLPADLVGHFVTKGSPEGKDPSPDFSTSYYVRSNPDVAQSPINPFFHYWNSGREEGRRPKAGAAARSKAQSKAATIVNVPKSEDLHEDYAIIAEEFSHAFYREEYPEMAQAEAQGTDLVLHYLEKGAAEGKNPHPDFSTTNYLAAYPDVERAGKNPFAHFIEMGRREGRIGKPDAPKTLSTDHPGKSAIKRMWDGYDDVRDMGVASQDREVRDTDALRFAVSFRGLGSSDVLRKLKETWPEDLGNMPEVSIVIPCVDQWIYTAECLASVARSDDASSIEIILVDNGSSDEFYSGLDGLPGLNVIHLPENIGFGPACNRGAASARGRTVLFLNNDAQIRPDCAMTLFRELDRDETAAAVVPKVLSFDGALQEAGCVISPSGEGRFVGYADDHRRPRFNYQRYLDYGSGVAMLVGTDAFLKLGGFDDAYAPAYYEDVDLCMKIRASGARIKYIPDALIAHHLSKSSTGSDGFERKMQRVVRNKQTFLGRWQRDLLAEKLKLIAFYLPQYHPIKENDRWWGKGFTEWTNVAKARANYDGHRQPRRPADLGYYDLRNAETMEEQAQLAARYGLSGFCYYYYWFDGKRLLERPLEQMLATGKPDFPFCLCWANENWTRTWDGMSQNVLIEQDYSEENDLNVIKDLARYFASDNYIRIDGKPLLLVYRVKELPRFARTAETWRNYARSIGVGEIIIASVESFELSSNPEDPSKYGCDISVEFPPHGMVHDQALQVSNRAKEFVGSVHDYRELAGEYMRREEPGWKRLRSVLVGWDNTPRRQDRSLVLEHATPGAFQAWLEWTITRTIEQNYGDERIVFINAWNEWCEGSYLEPDSDFGHGYLQALKNARDLVS